MAGADIVTVDRLLHSHGARAEVVLNLVGNRWRSPA